MFFVKIRHPHPGAFAPAVSSAGNSLPSDISRFTLQGPQVLLNCHLLRKTFLTSLSAVRECSLSGLSHCPPALSPWSPLYILQLSILFVVCTQQCQSWEGSVSPGGPSLRAGPLSLPNRSSQEGAACSRRNSQASFIEAALFHIDDSVRSPKAPYSLQSSEQGPLPTSAALQFLGKWLGLGPVNLRLTCGPNRNILNHCLGSVCVCVCTQVLVVHTLLCLHALLLSACSPPSPYSFSSLFP